MTATRFLGTTTDITTCECCGRRGLKKTVILVPLGADGTPAGDPTHYGTGCAARALGTTTKVVTKQAAAADKAKAQEVDWARRTLAKYPAADTATAARYAECNPHLGLSELGALLDVTRLVQEAEDTLRLYGLAA